MIWHRITHQASAAGGVAVFSRLPLCQDQTVTHVPLIEAVSARHGNELHVAVLYCHPNAKLEHILEAVRAVLPTATVRTSLLSADFNVDMNSEGGRRIAALLADRGLTATSDLTTPTTYAGTTIDAAFSNCPAMSVHRYQAYYSGHIPLIIDTPQSKLVNNK